jgi:cytochrome c biogenesis protein CcdA
MKKKKKVSIKEFLRVFGIVLFLFIIIGCIGKFLAEKISFIEIIQLIVTIIFSAGMLFNLIKVKKQNKIIVTKKKKRQLRNESMNNISFKGD